MPLAPKAAVLAALLAMSDVASAQSAPFDPFSSSGDSTLPSRPLPPMAVYFPPGVPTYGAPIPSSAARGPVRTSTRTSGGFTETWTSGSKSAPEELADDVGEYFYPALSTRLSEKSLSDSLAKRLAAYRANRAALLNELQDQLVVVQPLEPAARAAALREFARAQTPKIIALEDEAEKLRVDLVRGKFLTQSVNWANDREWRLTDRMLTARASLRPMAEYEILRAAVYYQRELTPQQRGLLREAAFEQADVARAASRRGGPPRERDPLDVFFSPATAHFRHPPDLPPDLKLKLGRFFHDRDVLKRELQELVIAQDDATEGKRDRAFRDLAERQWTHLVALEELAEEVRVGLAELPPPPRPTLPSHFPAELANRLADLQAAAAILANDRMAYLMKALAEARTRTFLDRLANNGRRRPAADDEGARAPDAPPPTQAKLEAEFDRANADRLARLKEQGSAIQADIVEYARVHRDPSTGKPYELPVLLGVVTSANRRFDQLGREEVIYRDYRTAMLEPGLSPEQRRLLFSTALVALAQPLPGGEELPSGKMPKYPVW